MWWGDRGLSGVSVGERSEPELLNIDEMWKAWKKHKHMPNLRIKQTLTCGHATMHKDKQARHTDHPVGSESSLYVAC